MPGFQPRKRGSVRPGPSLGELIEVQENVSFLVIRDGGLGDVLMCKPTLAALHETYGIPLTFATSPQFFPLLRDLPIQLEDAAKIDDRVGEYSWVFDLRNNLESYFVMRNKRHRVDAIAEFCDLDLADHTVNITLPRNETGWAKKWLKSKGFSTGTLIGICVRSAFRLRSWVETGPQKMVDILPDDFRYILFGTNDWYSWQHPRVYRAIDLPIMRVVALINQCAAVVSTDNGLMHIAGALGVPIVALFGSLPPKIRTRYYKDVITIVPDELPCVPCDEWQTGDPADHDYCRQVDVRCMRAIEPEMVADALTQLTG